MHAIYFFDLWLIAWCVKHYKQKGKTMLLLSNW
jgi:hypothetical protein